MKTDLEYSSKVELLRKFYIDCVDSIYSVIDKSLNNKRGYFGHIPSSSLSVNIIENWSKPGYNFLDIGSGVGNILRVAKEMSMNVDGLEVNKELEKWNQGLNVYYVDVLKSNFDFSKYDLIYLYRPIEQVRYCDDLFSEIFKTAKKGVIIIYVYPHLNEYKKVKNDGTSYLVTIEDQLKKFGDISLLESGFYRVNELMIKKKYDFKESYLVFQLN